ncbi:hypothetical protein [Curtobacterium sp. RRHDQ10]|uniref:hypothetical protein n=1 Tax=Curtobacterium phyllosphaerae TaxID=3413379 RepID=UPI003BF068D7
MPGTPPALVVMPDTHHGVAVLARQVAAAVTRVVGADVSVPLAALEGPNPPPRAHLHFTDRLWAGSPEEAADRIEAVARRTAVTVTLHDLPQPSDGARNLPRRADCYARVVAAADGVVVNSRHEAALLVEHTVPDHASDVGVIPLPVSPAPRTGHRPRPRADVAVLGFFYPGKGHAEVVDAVVSLRAAVADDRDGLGVTVLGRPSAGHEDELAALVTDAARRGVAVEVTGWLDDDDLIARARHVGVPAATHRHVSASGSIATWVEAGRRPLVPTTRYSTEMAALRPGTLTLVEDGDLAPAIARALEDPASTWIADDAVTRPDLRDTALAYLDWFTGRSA